MKRITLYFWLISFFFFLLSFYFFIFKNTLIDVNIYDTYYVILNSHLSLLLALVYTATSIIYTLISIKKIALISWLTKTHSIISITIVPLFFIGYFILNNNVESEFPLFDDSQNLKLFLIGMGILFLLTQFILIINIVFSTSISLKLKARN